MPQNVEVRLQRETPTSFRPYGEPWKGGKPRRCCPMIDCASNGHAAKT